MSLHECTVGSGDLYDFTDAPVYHHTTINTHTVPYNNTMTIPQYDIPSSSTMSITTPCMTVTCPPLQYTPSMYTDTIPTIDYTAQQQLHTDYVFLRKIDGEINDLLKCKLYIPCIELYESTISLRQQLYGEHHITYIQALQQLVILYNTVSMTCMNTEQLHECIAYLQRAEQLSQQNHTLITQRVQTLNNLACCYKRLNRCSTALQLLKEALALILLDSSSDNSIENNLYNDSRASTHLNMCALLSQLKHHEQAVEHARAAILHCQKSLLLSDKDTSDTVYERTVTLGIAYHNLGVEEEYLSHYGSALIWYEKALQLAQQHFSDNTQLINNFTKSYHSVQAITLSNKHALTTLSHTQQRKLLTCFKANNTLNK